MSKINAVAVKPNEPPYVRAITNRVEDWQSFVGGYVQAVPVWIGDAKYRVLCDEDAGHKQGGVLNIDIEGYFFIGPILIVRDTGREAYESITADRAQEVLDYLKNRPRKG